MRAPALVALALASACGPVATDPDAGAREDAATDAPPSSLSASIDGEAFAFVGTSTCFAVAHDGGEDAVVTIAWGDGEAEPIAATAIEACHVWTFPGPLVIGVTVEARGRRAEASALVQVVFEPAAVRPTWSSSIAYDAASDRVWVVEPDADVVTVIDATTRARLRTFAVGDRPRSVAITGGMVLVACEGDGTVHRVDGASLASMGRMALAPGSGPVGIVADPRGDGAWVTLQASGELVAIATGSFLPVGRVAVGRDPRAIAMRADGTIAITRWRGSQDAAAIVVVDGSDPAAPRVVGDVVLPREEGSDTDTDHSGVLSFLSSLAPSPDATRVIASGLKANVVRGLFRGSIPLSSQTTARAALAEVSIGAPGEIGRDTFRHRFDDLDLASAAIFSPMGDRIYVAMLGAEVVIAIDAFSFDSIGSIDDVGHAPDGLALDPSGRWLWVHAPLSREVRVYDVADLSRAPIAAATISTVESEPLDAEVLRGAVIFHSSRDPRMSRTRYLSCATCHLDGEADGLVWDFTQRGEGLRNTIPLRGRAGVAHGPLHWSANFDEVQDFEHDIRGGQGGTGFLPDDVFHVGTRDTTLGDPKTGLSAELDALAAYVSSLDALGASPHRRDGDAAWEAARARGAAIFTSAGCATCHAGAARTDSGLDAGGAPILHDVGTLGPGSGMRLGGALAGLDTPTLRGLWSSAPYLHDGSAPTLRAVLRDRNPDDRHGVTSTLSDAALDDLETYLLALDDLAP